MLMNKLGLKPGDFGVESEVRTVITLGLFAHSLQELSGGPKPEDILATLRSIPPVPVHEISRCYRGHDPDDTIVIYRVPDRDKEQAGTRWM